MQGSEVTLMDLLRIQKYLIYILAICWPLGDGRDQVPWRPLGDRPSNYRLGVPPSLSLSLGRATALNQHGCLAVQEHTASVTQINK